MLPCGLAPADQPIRVSESMSVLRLIPKVRQTAAFVAPPSSAATTAVIFSASIVTGRPPRRRGSRKASENPLLDQRALELRQRAEDVERNSPCGVVVSICSVSDRNAMPRAFSLFTVESSGIATARDDRASTPPGNRLT